MKVKIRGLVFVGFAAAVFAQSAMADNTTDAKTVTSKLYVDSKVDKVTGEGTQASPYGNTTITQNSPNDKAPSSQNVYKFVTTTVSNVAGNINGDNEYTKVTSTTSGGVTTKTVELQQAPATAGSDITGTLNTTTEKKLVTAGAVKSLIDTAAISSSSDATHLPTSQAVYNYAQPKVSTANALQVGYYTGSGDAAWKTLQADDTASVTHYVSIAQKTGDTNTYNVNLDNSTIASATTDFVASGDTNAGTKRPKLATAGAVYDFVKAENAAYQPKVSTDDTVMIGYKAASGNAGWQALNAGTYVEATSNGTATTVDIKSSQIASSIGNNSGSSAKLATEGAVYNFVTTGYQPVAPSGVKVGNNGAWDTLAVDPTYLGLNTATAGTVQVTVNTATTSAGISGASASNSTGANNLTTAYAVNAYVQGLLNGNVIPAADSDCQAGENGITSSNGKACALVMAYDSTANGGTGGVTLKWTPMAQ